MVCCCFLLFFCVSDSHESNQVHVNKVDVLFVYGSVANGTEKQQSDLNMLGLVNGETSPKTIQYLWQSHPVSVKFMTWGSAKRACQIESHEGVGPSCFINSLVLHFRDHDKLEKFQSFKLRVALDMTEERFERIKIRMEDKSAYSDVDFWIEQAQKNQVRLFKFRSFSCCLVLSFLVNMSRLNECFCL